MRAVVITRHGEPEVLRVEQRPDPPVGPGEVRVAVRAAGINFADLMARAGVYPDAPSPPCVVGYEVAGEVESVGEGVESHAVGDRVIAGTRFGGYAELVSVPVGQVMPLPEALSFEQGAAFPVNYATAYAALVIMGGLKADERLLIHAAAGGVGIAATQVAKGIGAEIFGTASASKHEAISAQGVDHAIDYRNAGLRRRGDADHGRHRPRPDHRRGRAVELSQGLRHPARRRAAGDVRALRGADGREARPSRGAARALPGCRWRRCRGGRASRS